MTSHTRPSQVAIPISMLVTWLLVRGTSHSRSQYLGALVVIGGIIVVLWPSFAHGLGDGGSATMIWAGVMVVSCVPMCLSSVYKEQQLGEIEMDVIYFNGHFHPCTPYSHPLGLMAGLLSILGRAGRLSEGDGGRLASKFS